MSRGQLRWQGRTLISLGRDELIEIARLLDRLLADRTGERLMLDRAYPSLSNEHLWAAIERLDQRLDRFRPLALPRLAAPGSATPTGSTSSRSDTPSPGEGSQIELGPTES